MTKTFNYLSVSWHFIVLILISFSLSFWMGSNFNKFIMNFEELSTNQSFYILMTFCGLIFTLSGITISTFFKSDKYFFNMKKDKNNNRDNFNLLKFIAFFFFGSIGIFTFTFIAFNSIFDFLEIIFSLKIETSVFNALFMYSSIFISFGCLLFKTDI